jgi:hypothetical protein
VKWLPFTLLRLGVQRDAPILHLRRAMHPLKVTRKPPPALAEHGGPLPPASRADTHICRLADHRSLLRYPARLPRPPAARLLVPAQPASRYVSISPPSASRLKRGQK